jgi:hypothetical protein
MDAFRPAPLQISFIAEDHNYIPGTDIYGIKWNDSYCDMRSLITNQSNWPYSELEIFIRTNLFIKEIGFNGRASCSGRSWIPAGVADANITATDKSGKSFTIPFTSPAFGTVFRIYCDKILGSETLEIVSAIIDFQKPRKKPSWVTLTASYNTFGRAEEKEIRKCFLEKCSGTLLPKEFSSNIIQLEPAKF